MGVAVYCLKMAAKYIFVCPSGVQKVKGAKIGSSYLVSDVLGSVTKLMGHSADYSLPWSWLPLSSHHK